MTHVHTVVLRLNKNNIIGFLLVLLVAERVIDQEINYGRSENRIIVGPTLEPDAMLLPVNIH
jgi:hypothetical protein